MKEISKYEKLVKKIAKELNSANDVDDVAQELRIHLLKDNVPDVSESYTRTVLKNKLHSMERTSIISGETWFTEELTDENGEDKVTENCTFAPKSTSAVEFLVYEELMGLINVFMENNDGNAKKLISNLINPSPELEEYWAAQRAKCARLTHYDFIPPTTVANWLNIPKNEYYNIINSLREVLSDHDYDIDYLFKSA